ncbi:MAG: hypothetical protein CME43_01830 [Haliea sp.]|uniref:Dam family site-specific DNA-(adenine-N6)-methyltransferase n=1 Tax=Haliea sp. TaxID=1932666 RepID=UPI000C56DA21|nr:Dam family site-specific DNA-(adenine-N6)-methyltransferase [Haliea sp.]MBM68201.1 hypothetical protein [Haliea sp.]|tara:strand:+ start:3694 stop:4494 length:801 start_codon:yes stop_codon:yes gene_type:complete
MTIKPPFHYTGNKYKTIPMIISNTPDGCGRYIDLFGGSGVVACNLASHGYENVCYNERDTKVFDLFNFASHASRSAEFKERLCQINNSYPDTKEAYLNLRQSYNECNSNFHLYLLVCRSFSNGIRFNSKGEFNLPYGERNHFDINRIEACSGLNISTFNSDFRDFKFYDDDWVFIDPPYTGTTATYNKGWSIKDDQDLFEMMDRFSERGIKFCYTNVLSNRGFNNDMLQDYLNNRKYNVLSTNGDFRNTSFRKSDEPTQEIMVMNY